MLLRRTIVISPVLSMLLRANRAWTAESEAGPVTLIEHFYADLLALMKQAKQLTFDARYARIAPTVAHSFDLGLMTRIAIGPGWTQLNPEQQERVTRAFSSYTVSVYANRFDDYSGERFEVDPKPTANQSGVIVSSRLVKANGEPVTLDYLTRQGSDSAWRIIDVYLSGTVSELATRRSEFVAVLQRAGPDGLARMIEQRAAALRTG